MDWRRRDHGLGKCTVLRRFEFASGRETDLPQPTPHLYSWGISRPRSGRDGRNRRRKRSNRGRERRYSSSNSSSSSILALRCIAIFLPPSDPVT